MARPYRSSIKTAQMFVDQKHRKYPSPWLIPKLYERLQDTAHGQHQWIVEYLSTVWHCWTPPKMYWELQIPYTLTQALESAVLLRESQPAMASKRHKLPWRVYNVVTEQLVML